MFLVVGAGLEYERLQMCFPGQIVFRGEFVLTDFETCLVWRLHPRVYDVAEVCPRRSGRHGARPLRLARSIPATSTPHHRSLRRYCSLLTAPITLRPTRAGAATRRRVKLVLEYDGSAFCGWQTQEARRRDGAVSTRGSSPAMRAVQDAVEAAVLALSTTADPSDQRPPTVVANGPRRACDGPGRGRVDLHGAQ